MNYYQEDGERYQDHLLDQYKLYVEMADRISSRRMLANSFFIGLHTSFLTLFALLLKEEKLQGDIVTVVFFLIAILLCIIWRRVIISYQQLNSGKFRVIHEIEEQLPFPLYKREWIALGEGKDDKKYLPLTHIENTVPIFFVVFYFAFLTMVKDELLASFQSLL